MASLVVSLTVTPVLASYLLPQMKAMKHDKEGFLVRFLKKWDERLLHWTLRNPWKVIAGAAALFLATISVLPFVGTEFLPPFNEGTLTINLLAQPGTSLGESDKLGQVAEKLLLTVPEVLSTGRRTGRAELDEHAEGVHYSEIDVDLKKSKRSREEILNDIREKLAVVPGVVVNVG
jgi:Cu/Ag efflux pump CusA